MPPNCCRDSLENVVVFIKINRKKIEYGTAFSMILKKKISANSSFVFAELTKPKNHAKLNFLKPIKSVLTQMAIST